MLPKTFIQDIFSYKGWCCPQLIRIAAIVKSIYPQDGSEDIQQQFIQCYVNSYVFVDDNTEENLVKEATEVWASSKLDSADFHSFVYVLDGDEDIEIFDLVASCLIADRHLVLHFMSRFLFGNGYFWTTGWSSSEGVSSGWIFCSNVSDYRHLAALLDQEGDNAITTDEVIVQNALSHCIQRISNILGPGHPVLEVAMSLAFSGKDQDIDTGLCVMCLLPNNEKESSAFYDPLKYMG